MNEVPNEISQEFHKAAKDTGLVLFLDHGQQCAAPDRFSALQLVMQPDRFLIVQVDVTGSFCFDATKDFVLVQRMAALLKTKGWKWKEQ